MYKKHREFQTPPEVGKYMVSLMPEGVKTVLEPTPGDGNIVKLLKGYKVIAQEVFFELAYSYVDCVVMNPPFTPMKLGYNILFSCMNKSNHVIALMPWLTIINGDKRTKLILDYGLKSVTHLPRTVFPKSRVQTCILELHKGYKGQTKFLFYGLGSLCK